MVAKTVASTAIMTICGLGMRSFMLHAGCSDMWSVIGAIAVSLPAYGMALVATNAIGQMKAINKIV
jgi:hypothetical protein